MRLALGVLQRLHSIVDVDGNGSRDSRQIAAHHQDNAEFAQGVRETQNHGGYDSGQRQRQNDSPEGPQASAPRTAEASRSF